MAISVVKFAPSAVVLTFVGYCAWPSVCELTSSSSPSKQQKKSDELPAALLTPVLGPCPTKNPWGGKDAATLAADKKKELAAQAAARSPSTSKAVSKPSDLLAGVKLDATCIIGNQRWAVISGHTYAIGQTIPSAASGNPPLRLTNVLPHKVLLECEGKTLALAYADVFATKSKTVQVGKSSSGGASPAGKPKVAAAASLPNLGGATNQAGK